MHDCTFKKTNIPLTSLIYFSTGLIGISSIITFEIRNRIVFLKNNSFIKASPNSTFNVHNPHGIKLLTSLRVRLSHLYEHKFRHSQDPLCKGGRYLETTIIHYFLHCSNYSNQRNTLFDRIMSNVFNWTKMIQL